MPKRIALCVTPILLAMIGASFAGSAPGPHPATPPAQVDPGASTHAETSDDPTVTDGIAASQRIPVTAKLLAEIAAWISATFHLPPPRELPNVEFVPQEQITDLRYRGLMNRQPADAPPRPALFAEEVEAVYVHTTRTIYLRDEWRGESSRDLSVLVHEMVHHLQHQAQIKYHCSEEREKLAYQAQDRWLTLYGSTLKDEFGIDRMTLLVRTNCML